MVQHVINKFLVNPKINLINHNISTNLVLGVKVSRFILLTQPNNNQNDAFEYSNLNC